MNPNQDTQIDRSSSEYAEGRIAFAKWVSREACPYEHGQARMDWFSGWLDKWSEAKHGKLFKQYGVDDGINRCR